MVKANREVLQRLLTGAVAASGYELWGFDYIPQKRQSLLRVYIDKKQGVNIDDCEKASRQIQALLEVEAILPENITLEVSSPGLERPLYTPLQYQQYLGERVKIRLHKGDVGKRFNYTGILNTADNQGIQLEVDGELIHFAFGEIEKANLLVEI